MSGENLLGNTLDFTFEIEFRVLFLLLLLFFFTGGGDEDTGGGYEDDAMMWEHKRPDFALYCCCVVANPRIDLSNTDPVQARLLLLQ